MVTIVIPCYNQAQYLEDAIKSALYQTHLQTEVLVVNDGSTDHTLSVALKYPITVITQPNRGLPGARNSGIRLARGEYIVCLDADDKLDDRYIELCLKEITTNTGFVRTGLKHFGEEHSILTPSLDTSKEAFLVNNQAYPPSMFPRKVWEAIGGYDETMTEGYEDWDFWARIVWAGYEVKTIQEPLFHYRKHGESMITRSREKHDELTKYIKQKHLCDYS